MIFTYKFVVNKIRIIIFFTFMGFFVVAYQIGSMTAIAQEDAEEFMSEFEKLVSDIDAFGIFLHNTTIALPMFIPGFGLAWGLFSAWSTGMAFASIATINPTLENMQPLTILFLSHLGLWNL